MNEKTMNMILESLAETIDRLRLDVYFLKCENDRLKKQIKKEGASNA